MATTKIPLVEYLVLSDPPHLQVRRCTSCGARFFDRRNACAACGRDAFETVAVDTTGEVRTFTIVNYARPGVEVPFVAAVVQCGETTVSGKLLNVPADPQAVTPGTKVRLTTYSLGVDDAGVEAVGYAFEPLDGNGSATSKESTR